MLRQLLPVLTLFVYAALAWSQVVFAQTPCGFFDPKVTFPDGSRACLAEFPFFTRKDMLSSFSDHVALAKSHSTYAIATTSTPERCPFARFTVWDRSAQDAEAGCRPRLRDAVRKSAEFADCDCDTLIDSGRTRLSRRDFERRLVALEHFLVTQETLDQTKNAQIRKVEEERRRQERDNQAKAQREREQERPPKQVLATRRALVIGNDTYRYAEALKTAREDARAIAANLEQVGYIVSLHLDLSERAMKAAVRTFVTQIQGGDEVAFFFAGHGLQIGSTNYLIPIDTAGESELQIRDEAVDLKRILDDVGDRRARFTLAVIDACRDNPFRDKTRVRMIGTSGRGLAPTTPATGQMIIFSAGAGQKALDNLGDKDPVPNGVFTRVFVQQMRRPSISIDRIARDTRAEVVRLASSIGHEQVPAIYDQVIGEFFFIR